MANHRSWLATSAHAVLDVAFPPTCPACGMGGDGAAHLDFCAGCLADLERFDDAVCLRCSSPLPGGSSDASDCAACRTEKWAFDRVIALGPYQGLLRRLALDAKRPAGEPAILALGRLLADRVRGAVDPDAVVAPVPQHWTRQLFRRANGVDALSRSLAANLKHPHSRLLRRTRRTRRQTSVAPSDRRANVRGSFAVREPSAVSGGSVLLVDDVFTTGATCHTAARALKQAGATRVVAVVAARRVGSL